MSQCFRCGDDDHLSYDCPNATRPRSAPPAVWPSATADHGSPTPAPPPVPPRRPESEIADPAPWADQIRRVNGWARGGMADELRRALALEQCAESRASRFVS